MANILVISPTPSHPQDAGNRARIFSLLSGLRAAGHRVYFVLVKKENGDESAMEQAWDGFYSVPYQRPEDRWTKRTFDKWAKKLGSARVLPYRIDDWYTSGISRRLREIKAQVQPDVVLVEYVFLSRAFECFAAETLKVLDTHDVFGDRHKLYLGHGTSPVFFYTSQREEQRALDRAGLILAIQAEEADYFSRQTKQKVMTVGHLVPDPEVSANTPGEPNRLLFVGSANDINLDGLSWFLEAIFPRLRQAAPDIELDVVGKSATRISGRSGVNLLGPVDDLTPYYRRAAVVINPLRFGTGLKIKTIEALAFGKPLVTTSIGAAGLEEEKGKAFLIADSAEEFSDKVLQLLRSPKLSGEVGERARQYAQSYNNKALAPLLEFLSGKPEHP